MITFTKEADFEEALIESLKKAGKNNLVLCQGNILLDLSNFIAGEI